MCWKRTSLRYVGECILLKEKEHIFTYISLQCTPYGQIDRQAAFIVSGNGFDIKHVGSEAIVIEIPVAICRH